MLIEEIIGNIADQEHDHPKTVEWIELDWEHLRKRIVRATTDAGTEVRIRLPEGQSFEYGSVLYEDDDRVIAVRTEEEMAFVVQPKNDEELYKAAYEIGNRHAASLFQDGEIVLRDDHTLDELMDSIGVAYTRDKRRFKEAFVYRGHGDDDYVHPDHDHDHDHNHDHDHHH